MKPINKRLQGKHVPKDPKKRLKCEYGRKSFRLDGRRDCSSSKSSTWIQDREISRRERLADNSSKIRRLGCSICKYVFSWRRQKGRFIKMDKCQKLKINVFVSSSQLRLGFVSSRKKSKFRVGAKRVMWSLFENDLLPRFLSVSIWNRSTRFHGTGSKLDLPRKWTPSEPLTGPKWDRSDRSRGNASPNRTHNGTVPNGTGPVET